MHITICPDVSILVNRSNFFSGVLASSCLMHTHTSGNQTAREQNLVIIFTMLNATEVKKNKLISKLFFPTLNSLHSG